MSGFKAGAVGALVAVALAGVGWKSWRDGQALAAKVAQQAAITKAAEARADSFRVALEQADRQARADSIVAAQARARAANAEALSVAAVQANRILRARLELVGDTAVRIDSGVVIPIPTAVARQLVSDDSTITALRGALVSKDSAYAALERLDADHQAQRDDALGEVAALRTANAALHAQVKLLAPPKCGRTCGLIVGAGGALLAVAAVKRL